MALIIDILQQIDLSVLFIINMQLANPLLDLFFKLLHYASYPLVGLVVAYFAFKKETFILGLIIGVVIASTMVSAVLKESIHRERPYQALDVRQLVEEDNDRSFPSNHAQMGFAIASIAFYFRRRLGILMFAFAALVGLSRVYLGVHYPSDVIGGTLIGIILALMIVDVGTAVKKNRPTKN